MTEQLQRELLQRSLELNFPWCSVFPAQWRNFTVKGWVLLIDRRIPGQSCIATFPIEDLAKMTFPCGKSKMRKKKS